MQQKRSGILLHISSLPGNTGIGTLGKASYDFVNWLSLSRQTLWQILPLGPTGYGDSPYSSFSAFAGNPYFVDFDLLVQKGWAEPSRYSYPFSKNDSSKNERVDYGFLSEWKAPLLEKCAFYFLENSSSHDKDAFEKFCTENDYWLSDYAVFMSIKNYFDKKAKAENVQNSLWYSYWPKEFASYEKDAIENWQKEHEKEIKIIKVIQFFFDFQWQNLRNYCKEKGVLLIGDIPIFVAPDSSDVWANQKFFMLDEKGCPRFVAGVPPDYFSQTGQLWGNPLYDWNAMKSNGYDWWISRIRRNFSLVDCVRLDHFRGFDSFWKVPYGSENAVNGIWEAGPGIDFFNCIKNVFGKLNFIAEDLGVITDEVRNLQKMAGFPGMKVLQFAFNAEDAKNNGMVNAFLPCNFSDSSCICYTGTHDNDTLQGYLLSENENTLQLIASYAFGENVSVEEAKKMAQSGVLCEKIVKLAFSSNAKWVIVPLQDFLHLDSSSRMNMPSSLGQNWSWRVNESALNEQSAKTLLYTSFLYGRNFLKAWEVAE